MSKSDEEYRRRFNAEYEKVYGAPFKTYVASTKAYIQKVILQPYGRRLAEEALRHYQGRIKYIKSVIDHEQVQDNHTPETPADTTA